MATYLVTGAAGFIGSSIAEALLDRGDTVRGIDNLSTGKLENVSPLIARGLEFLQGDIRNVADCERAAAGIDIIFHEAALPSVPKSVIDPVSSHQSNIEGPLNILMAAKNARVKRIVYAGSSSAYGDTPTLPKREDMKPNPISPYAVQKLTGELYLQSFAQVYGMETVTIRYFNVFGPRQDPTSAYSGVLAKFTMMMLEGQEPTIYGDGKQSRDFTFISDVVNGNLLAAHAPASKVSGKVFNVACNKQIDLNEAVQELRNFTGYTGPVHYGEDRAGDVKHSLADISAARDAFGYVPKVTFAEGLRRTVDWYKEQEQFAGAAAGDRTL
ncbi:MAG: SDR family oxidoreductase [Acidobacteriaceae bacterium]